MTNNVYPLVWDLGAIREAVLQKMHNTKTCSCSIQRRKNFIGKSLIFFLIFALKTYIVDTRVPTMYVLD